MFKNASRYKSFQILFRGPPDLPHLQGYSKPPPPHRNAAHYIFPLEYFLAAPLVFSPNSCKFSTSPSWQVAESMRCGRSSRNREDNGSGQLDVPTVGNRTASWHNQLFTYGRRRRHLGKLLLGKTGARRRNQGTITALIV